MQIAVVMHLIDCNKRGAHVYTTNLGLSMCSPPLPQMLLLNPGHTFAPVRMSTTAILSVVPSSLDVVIIIASSIVSEMLSQRSLTAAGDDKIPLFVPYAMHTERQKCDICAVFTLLALTQTHLNSAS